MSNEKNKPVETIRVGSVKIAIWKNEGEDGPYYTAGQPEVSYRDKGTDKWHTSKSLSGRDLVNTAKAALLADSAIGKLRAADKKAAAQPEENTDQTDDAGQPEESAEAA